ncbi:polypeptide N-acetylgalactosaminyltransferase 17 isoform X2 [Anguilla anguilla]|uniref:polypeptide N-acetylgalactosaminyltransferase 17 isoform X2 n=1 Tax=Anguilla anguilla TaxID=7936 RepID=UPI0015AE9379|nr:polypeptide N-acetylgalactosaminyltransferase 17 isoform X2 [Anguilla anguilla]
MLPLRSLMNTLRNLISAGCWLQHDGMVVRFRSTATLMAFVLRRWKILLVMNVIAVAGFMSFWAKCSSSTITAIGQNSHGNVKRHSRYNLTIQRSSISHEALLKRLASLEDVVYRQLNGFGGRGKGGLPATLSPAEEANAKYLREKYGYNAYLSDRISLDRSIPDFRPSKCKKYTYPRDLPQISLIFIFVNEALSVILRSVHSAVNHTPAHLLKEIILVDDNSDDGQLKAPLEEYVSRRYPGLVKIVRNRKREGLIRARIEGWKVATGEVTGFFDAHVEFTPSWAEPVLARIKEDRRRIILPSIDNIKHDTFALEHYEKSGHGYNWQLWCMYINPPKEWWDEGDIAAPIRTPAMIGCSFVAHHEYFGELGLLDDGMDVYGGENIELGIRVWLCGGSMEVLPCSRVAHMARLKKPYLSDITIHARRNALRVAEVWMDEYKSNVYMAWNLPMDNHGIDYGDISQRLALRKRLHCKNFEWYLDNVYPEMRRYNNTVFYGEIRNSRVSHLCMDQGSKENHTAILHPCHGLGPQLGRYTREGLLYLGPLGSTGEETSCVVDDHVSSLPQLLNCDEIPNKRAKTWHFSQNDSIVNQATGRCLEVVPANVYFGYLLVLQSCTGQKWSIKYNMKQL